MFRVHSARRARPKVLFVTLIGLWAISAGATESQHYRYIHKPLQPGVKMMVAESMGNHLFGVYLSEPHKRAHTPKITLESHLKIHAAAAAAYISYGRNERTKLTQEPKDPKFASRQEIGVVHGIRPSLDTSHFCSVLDTYGGNLFPVAGARVAAAAADGDTDAMHVLREVVQSKLGPNALDIITDAHVLGKSEREATESLLREHRDFLKERGLSIKKNSLAEIVEHIVADNFEVHNWSHLTRFMAKNGTFHEFGRFWINHTYSDPIRDPIFALALASLIEHNVYGAVLNDLADHYMVNYTLGGALARYFGRLAAYENVALSLKDGYYDCADEPVKRDVAFQIVPASTKVDILRLLRQIVVDKNRAAKELFYLSPEQVNDIADGKRVPFTEKQRKILESADLQDTPTALQFGKVPWPAGLEKPDKNIVPHTLIK